MTCSYTGHHFGAPYPDAQCINGYLWDSDSYEDGMLTSGGDMPCPHCNLELWVADAAEEADNGALNSGIPNDQPHLWLTRVLLSPFMQKLHGIQAFVLAGQKGWLNTPWYGPEGVDVEEPIARIAWPWPLPDTVALTQHERFTILAALADAPIPAGFSKQPDGLVLGPIGP